MAKQAVHPLEPYTVHLGDVVHHGRLEPTRNRADHLGEYQMPTFDSDRAMSVLGVAGRLTHRTTKPGQPSHLWFRQRWISEARPIDGYRKGATLRVEMHFDDDCGNGHNTFAMTAEVREQGARDIAAGGCLHDDIARIFPELAPLIKWHLVSTDGPMHYVANALYHAGDRDHSGKRKGEPRAWESVLQFGENPIKHKLRKAFVQFLQNAAPHPGAGAYDFEVIAVPYERGASGTNYNFEPKYTFGGFDAKWHECPFNTETEALDFLQALQTCSPHFVRIATAWGEGKERNLEAARNVAVWPEATDEELCAEREALKAALEARLPALLAAFRADMESIGFLWSPEDFKA